MTACVTPKWLRINVTGTGGAAAAPVTAPAPRAAPVAAPPVVKHEETAKLKLPPVVAVTRFTPGSSEWNNLNTSWGYSNYAVAQLKTAGYERYAELARLNAAMTLVINAKTVEQGAYNSLMTSWNTFVTEAKFQALMHAVVPGTGKK